VAALPDAHYPSLAPTPPGGRVAVLDVLRGFAVLGILLINIEFMRGSDLYAALAGLPIAVAPLDGAVQFVLGWLVAGKFLSSLAILFGIGAGLIADRALRAGRSPHALLARRYVILLIVGLAHMFLLFPGDILFLYGLSGLVLLAFLRLPPERLIAWAAGLLLASTALLALLTGADQPGREFVELMQALRAQTAAAYAHASYLDIVSVHAPQAMLIQLSQLFLLPWVAGLFLVGLAVTRWGLATDVASHAAVLRRIALMGLGVGLPVNLLLGPQGPLGTAGATGADQWLSLATTTAQLLGAPLLAAGYLAGLALLTLRLGAWPPLAAVGRMALTAYLAQGLLALIVFSGLNLYDRLGTAQALLVVLVIWAVLLVACRAWLKVFRYGPVEWLWRSATYGRREALRESPGQT
jgi:uncharacterized protein